MIKRDVRELIEEFNQNREPDLLKLKYQKMAADSFSFFRGTCHLFYQDWPTDSPLNDAPASWICGDSHLENFGSFKGDNRLVYFGINDFDESALAPCTWDVARFLTSILVAAKTLSVTELEAMVLCNAALNSYVNALAIGHVYTVERETAVGLVKDLLISLRERDRQDFLNKRTNKKNGQRQLKINNKNTQAVTQAECTKVTNLIDSMAITQVNPYFFKVLDVAHRLAGNSSLGLERYVILIEGNGSPNQNYLLDLKAMRESSSLQPYLKLTQPQWSNQAERSLTNQKRMQGNSPALLLPLEEHNKSYVLRELQPTEDRVNLSVWNGTIRRLERVVETMGSLTAWSQLRSAARSGSALPDDLISFGQNPSWKKEILNYAQTYSRQVEADYQSFCELI